MPDHAHPDLLLPPRPRLYNLPNNGFQSCAFCPCPSLTTPPLGPSPSRVRTSPLCSLAPTLGGRGPQMGEHSPLGKLSVSAQLHSAPHVWLAVIRPAKQPALKMPFNEKRPTLRPWCSGAVWLHLLLSGTTALCWVSRFSLPFQLTANLTADIDGY